MSETYPSSRLTFNIKASKPHGPNCSTLPTRSLVTPRRFDLAVKWRLFCHLRHGGNDPESERVYCWHIARRRKANLAVGVGMDGAKRNTDYLAAAQALYGSMAQWGFQSAFAVPVDPDGELLGGAHRVACALALDIADIHVIRESRKVWAPAWDEQWFVDNGLVGPYLERLRSDYAVLARVGGGS